MENTIKSLAALLFNNLMEILNHNNKKEEIVSLVKIGLTEKISEIFDEIDKKIEIHNKRKENAEQPTELDGFFYRCEDIKKALDYFKIIDNLTALNTHLSNLDYLLSDKDIEIFKNLKRFIEGNEYIRGASRVQVIANYGNFSQYKPLFKRKKVEILVECVIVPIMIKEKKQNEVINFLSNTNNYFRAQRGKKTYTYPDSYTVSLSIHKLINQYKETILPIEPFDKESFVEYLKSIFLQLEDSSQERQKQEREQYQHSSSHNKTVTSSKDRMIDIESFISEKLGKILEEETCGIVAEEKNSIYMRIATLIEEDFIYYNAHFKLNWEECKEHNGFKALRYYRMYKILCDYKDNDSLNELGQALIQECWKETLIYISPDANIVAPVYIGKNCLITSSCWIEQNVMVGHGTKILSSRIRSDLTTKNDDGDEKVFSLIRIKSNTIIMPNSLIYDAARIEENCIISTSSVVREDIKKTQIFINGIPKPIDTECISDMLTRYIEQLRKDESECARI